MFYLEIIFIVNPKKNKINKVWVSSARAVRITGFKVS